MRASREVIAVARADFLERVRRYSFLVTLLFAIYLGYATAKGQISIQLDEYRGLYTSGWMGTLVALVVACFVSLVGFYIVKNSVERDRSTSVGQILAATPLAKSTYALGKLVSNFALLSSMVVVLALGAVVMQFLVAEDPRVDLWALLAPFVFIALPVMALTAGAALFFEMAPVLRGGVGNVIWFFAWSFGLALPLITGLNWLDPSGIVAVMQSLSVEARQHVPGYHGGMAFQINLGQIHVARDWRWPGLSWTWDAVLLRLVWFAVAIGLAFLASLIFDRFDSTRSTGSKRETRKQAGKNALRSSEPPPAPLSGTHLVPISAEERSAAFAKITIAELRLALQGLRWWWYLVAAGLLIAQFAAPLEISRGPLLAVAWIWPVLIWSAMGSRESRFGMRPLLFSCAKILPRQFAACWLAGFVISCVTGVGAVARLITAGNFHGLAGWLAGAVFLPSLALALGIWSGTSKLFEGLFTMWWYVGPMNHVPGLDFTGTANGTRTVPLAFVYTAASAALLVGAYFVRSRQLQSSQ